MKKGFKRQTFSKIVALASSLFVFTALVPQFVAPAQAAVPTFTLSVMDKDGNSDDKILVKFDQGVSGTSGGSSALAPADFTVAGSDALTITAVEHNAGDTFAVLDMSGNIDIAGAGEITIACANNAIFDENTADACVQGATDVNAATEDATPPVVTDAAITVDGNTGLNNTFKIGDVLRVRWDNSAQGDNNLDTEFTATVDFSAVGGGTAVEMTDGLECNSVAGNDVYGACITVTEGNIDAANLNVSVTVTDHLNTPTTTADTSNISLDNIRPTLTTVGTLTISEDKITQGVAEPGDFVTYVEGTGSNNDGETWTLNLSDLTGNAAATAQGSPYEVKSGPLSGTVQFTETVTDNAGNTDTDQTAGTKVSNLVQGGGGGGGGNNDDPVVDNPSNEVTEESSEDIDVIDIDSSYYGPIEVKEVNVVDEENDMVSVKITEDATLTLKPNSDATIWLKFPEFTTLTAKSIWDRKINPPLVKNVDLIKLAGEKIKGSVELLKRENVTALIEVLSNTPLEFDKTLTLGVPVNLADGTKVKVYSTDELDTEWALEGTVEVKDKMVEVKTDHLSFFALVAEKTTTPEEEEEEEEQPEEGEEEQPGTFVSPFTDIKGHWAENYINKLAEMKIVSGKTATIFDPNANITRCELTKIAVNAFGVTVDPVVTEKPFSDIEITDWCAPYAAAAKKAGIVEGVGNNMFAPNQNIDRAQAVTIFIRAGEFGEPTTKSTFKDVKDTEWYAKYVIRATELGIVSGYGDGTFGPSNNMTRAEATKVTVETLNDLK